MRRASILDAAVATAISFAVAAAAVAIGSAVAAAKLADADARNTRHELVPALHLRRVPRSVPPRHLRLAKGKFTPLEYDAKGYRSPKGLVDQKGRKLDVHCPASTAPKAMLPIDSAAALARGYYEAAGVDHPPSKESVAAAAEQARLKNCLLYTSPSPRDAQ